MFFWVVAAAVSLVVVAIAVYADGKRNEKGVARDWELILTQKGQQELGIATERIDAELELVDLAYEQAHGARERGSQDEALELLDMGCEMIESYCPTMLRALTAMSVLSRMVAVMAPVPPVRPRSFKLRELVQLAYLNQFLHQFLVSTKERFRLRLAILARGFVTLRRVVFRSTRRVHAVPGTIGDELPQLDAARRDVRTLSEESLESLRLLLTSFAAERR